MTASGHGRPRPPGRPGRGRALAEVLERARDLGLLGPGPVEPHIEHALGFGEAAGGAPAGPVLDLGSGGGIPGLVLAVEWPATEWLLLDSRTRSTRLLRDAVPRLGLRDRVHVLEARAEAAAHEVGLRGTFELVVARGFAAPAVTAECGAGFLVVGGRLVVSEPPGSTGGRWPPEPLATLGMGGAHLVESRAGHRYAVVGQEEPCPARYPRRVGVPAKRPLF